MKLFGHGKFHRLRIIGHQGHKDRVTGWVLGKPGSDDEIMIGRAIDVRSTCCRSRLAGISTRR